MGGSLTMKNGKIDKYLFEGGYAQASVASSTTDNFAFYYYNQDHLGYIREVVGARGQVLAPPPSRKGDATYLSPDTSNMKKYQTFDYFNGVEDCDCFSMLSFCLLK